MFGSIQMAYRGSSLKVHSIRSAYSIVAISFFLYMYFDLYGFIYFFYIPHSLITVSTNDIVYGDVVHDFFCHRASISRF